MVGNGKAPARSHTELAGKGSGPGRQAGGGERHRRDGIPCVMKQFPCVIWRGPRRAAHQQASGRGLVLAQRQARRPTVVSSLYVPYLNNYICMQRKYNSQLGTHPRQRQAKTNNLIISSNKNIRILSIHTWSTSGRMMPAPILHHLLTYANAPAGFIASGGVCVEVGADAPGDQLRIR